MRRSIVHSWSSRITDLLPMPRLLVSAGKRKQDQEVNDLVDQFVSHYVEDVSRHPDCFDDSVVQDPVASARRIINGLKKYELQKLLFLCRREKRLLKKRGLW